MTMLMNDIQDLSNDAQDLRNDLDSISEWPSGSYCIFRKGGSCPSGFSEGRRLHDDEDDSNRNSVSGQLPDGIYNGNTQYEFCCK